jgi:hypothetical protein
MSAPTVEVAVALTVVTAVSRTLAVVRGVDQPVIVVQTVTRVLRVE